MKLKLVVPNVNGRCVNNFRMKTVADIRNYEPRKKNQPGDDYQGDSPFKGLTTISCH